tara:strand:+ start:107 stop:703 length:597 start_codon:yes stop_codon:yes gene_type:complete
MRILECNHCKESFEAKAHNAKYCSLGCRRKQWRIDNRDSYLAQQKKYTDKNRDMRNTLTVIALLISLLSYSQTNKYTFKGKTTNGVVATVWDNDYIGNIIIKNDTIYITPRNDKATKQAYSITKSKTKVEGSGKKGKTTTSYSVESLSSIDDDIKVKIILTLFNKPHKVIGSRIDNMQIISRDTFTETNSIVQYYIVR